MRLATINLPTHDNAGVSLAVETDFLRNLILDNFGGFTETSARGAWKDDATGIVYREPVTVFSIGMDATLENASLLRLLAGRIARDAAQVCVFITQANGDVEFVSPETVDA